MSIGNFLDRKLFMLVGSLVAKRLGTVLATYLVATGIPSDSAGQLLSAIAAVLALASDIIFDHLEKRRVADKATRQLLDAQGKTSLDDDWYALFEKHGH